MTARGRICWWEPMARRRPEVMAELAQVYSPTALLRIVGAVLLVTALAALLLPRWLPELDVNWGLALLKALGVGAVLIAVSAALCLLPRRVSVDARGIYVGEGQSGRLYRFTDLAECRLDESERSIYLRRPGRTRAVRIDIAAAVDLARLRALLPFTGRRGDGGTSYRESVLAG